MFFGNGFPGFSSGGGFPFGGMHGGQDDDNISEEAGSGQKDTKLYEILEVQQNASIDDIRKAYKKKARVMHPDRGGDTEKFKELQQAHEILTNPEKRELYDRYGMDGLKEGGPGGMGGFDDILGGLFGMGGRGKKQSGPKKGKPVLKELKITLQDVYIGKMHTLEHKRKRICQTCDGKGGSNTKDCTTCKGKGMVTKMVMLAPGMYQQSTQPCSECRGEGRIIPEKERCKTCKGQKVNDEKKTIEVPIEQGVPDKHDYIFHGEADEYPGIMGGDLYVRLNIEPHPVFKRKGADLYMEKNISLLEALTGFNFEIEHLDGHKIRVTTLPGETICHGDIKQLKGKGMPFYKDSMSHGNLYINFHVKFPKRGELSEKQISALKDVLPGPKHKPLQKGEKVEYLDDFDEADRNHHAEGGQKRQADDDDDEDGMGGGMPGQGQRVQCHQS